MGKISIGNYSCNSFIYTEQLKNAHWQISHLAMAVKVIVASYNKSAMMSVIGCLAAPHPHLILGLMRITPRETLMACLLTLKEIVMVHLSLSVNLKG